MKNIIKKFEGRFGTITLTEYDEYGEKKYCVQHTRFQAYWTYNKTEAIRHYQFLCGKY